MAMRVSFWLLYILFLVPFYFFLFRKSGEGLGIFLGDATLLGGAIVVMLMIRRSHRRQDRFFEYSFVKPNPRVINMDVPREVREYLVRRAAIISALLIRASSEWFLQHKELPPEIEVITRRAQNELLRKEGLWEVLEADEADLFRAADGHWTAIQLDQSVAWCEQLRLLRWTLGLDTNLFPLHYFPRVDISAAKGIVEAGNELFRGKKMLAPWDVRVERDVSSRYFLRCLAEKITRGQLVEPEADAWARTVREECHGPSTDLLVGVQTVGELDDEKLHRFWLCAYFRMRYANYLVDLLGSDGPVTFAVWSQSQS